jgi:hypothetical protein
LAVYPFAEEQAIHVVAAAVPAKNARVGRAAYDGPFRFEVLRVSATRDFRETDNGTLHASLEIAWEPRMAPVILLQRMADVHAVDDRGESLSVANRDAQLDVSVQGCVPAVVLDLPFRLPPRDARKIARLHGDMTAVIAGKIETFRFSKPAQAKNVEQRMASAVVLLEQARKNLSGWEVRIRVRFDEAGDALASHRTWIFNNEAFLETADGKKIAPASYETTLQKKNEVGVAFSFPGNDPIDDKTFVYKTPGAILTKTLKYELRDIPLP